MLDDVEISCTKRLTIRHDRVLDNESYEVEMH
jgi:hypothetical protein